MKERVLVGNLDPICGIFSQIGAIALNAILDANIHLNETVAIFGQGVPRLMITQLAKLSGVKIIAIDTMDSCLEYVKSFGVDYTINSTATNVAKVCGFF